MQKKEHFIQESAKHTKIAVIIHQSLEVITAKPAHEVSRVFFGPRSNESCPRFFGTLSLFSLFAQPPSPRLCSRIVFASSKVVCTLRSESPVHFDPPNIHQIRMEK